MGPSFKKWNVLSPQLPLLKIVAGGLNLITSCPIFVQLMCFIFSRTGIEIFQMSLEQLFVVALPLSL